MDKVWLVNYEVDCESHGIVGIFSSEQKAWSHIDWIFYSKNQHNTVRSDYSIEERDLDESLDYLGYRI